MKKVSKFLTGAVIAAGLADVYMARRVYIKKKGTVIKDMAIKDIEEKLRGRGGESGKEGARIEIE